MFSDLNTYEEGLPDDWQAFFVLPLRVSPHSRRVDSRLRRDQHTFLRHRRQHIILLAPVHVCVEEVERQDCGRQTLPRTVFGLFWRESRAKA